MIDNVKAFKNELRNLNYYKYVYSKYFDLCKKINSIKEDNSRDEEEKYGTLYKLLRPFNKPYLENTYLKLYELSNKMNGVSAVSFDKAPSTFNESLSEQMRISMIEKYNELLKKIKEELETAHKNLVKETSYYQKSLIHIDEILAKLPPDIRNVVIEIYGNGKKYEDISNGNNVFWSPSGVYLNVNKELERVLNEVDK